MLDGRRRRRPPAAEKEKREEGEHDQDQQGEDSQRGDLPAGKVHAVGGRLDRVVGKDSADQGNEQDADHEQERALPVPVTQDRAQP